MIQKFRIIPQLEKYAWATSFIQTLIGQFCLAGVAAYFMRSIGHTFWFEASVAVLIASIFRIRDRRTVLVALALYIALFRPLGGVAKVSEIKYFLLHLSYMQNWLFLKDFAAQHASGYGWIYSSLISAGTIAFSIMLIRFIIRSKNTIIKNWPIGSLLFADLFFIFFADLLPREVSFTRIFWLCIVLFNTIYLSNFGYVLLHQKKLANQPIWTWIGPGVLFSFPFGKSNAYLQPRAATDSYELAVTQIKGLKLLVWMWLARFVLATLSPLLGLPGWPFAVKLLEPYSLGNLSTHYSNFINHTPSPTGTVWLTLFVTYFYDLLLWMMKFNAPVVLLRLLGFYVPRGMYKPLYAKSIPDYFGRRYYYYKEFIFDLFVLPAILRLHFVQNRKVRTFLAIFAGVSLGTMLTHTWGSIAELYTIGALDYLVRSIPFYSRCIGFGLLIAIFQFGNPLPVDGKPYARLRHVVNVLIIIFIFSLAKAFTPMMRTDNATDAFRFFESLFTF